MYQLINDADTNVQMIKKLPENLYIPIDLDNTDYQTYLKWVAEGNIPLPADQ